MARFKIDDEVYDLLDDSKLLFAEADAVERATGFAMAEWGRDDIKGRASFVQAMLWVSMKRRNPPLTLAEVGNIPLASVEWIADEEPASDPTDLAEGE